MVLAAIERLLEVEHPHGRAGIDVVVVEHAIHCHVLPRSHHHLLRDVAHRCTHTNKTYSLSKKSYRLTVTTSLNPTLALTATTDPI